MIRVFHVCIAFVVLTGHALAQIGPPPANGPAAAQGPGRAGFAPIVVGPSAPVSPEVAIPRPTPAELAQVNDALTKWIASDKSSAKPLLQNTHDANRSTVHIGGGAHVLLVLSCEFGRPAARSRASRSRIAVPRGGRCRPRLRWTRRGHGRPSGRPGCSRPLRYSRLPRRHRKSRPRDSRRSARTRPAGSSSRCCRTAPRPGSSHRVP